MELEIRKTDIIEPCLVRLEPKAEFRYYIDALKEIDKATGFNSSLSLSKSLNIIRNQKYLLN